MYFLSFTCIDPLCYHYAWIHRCIFLPPTYCFLHPEYYLSGEYRVIRWENGLVEVLSSLEHSLQGHSVVLYCFILLIDVARVQKLCLAHIIIYWVNIRFLKFLFDILQFWSMVPKHFRPQQTCYIKYSHLQDIVLSMLNDTDINNRCSNVTEAANWSAEYTFFLFSFFSFCFFYSF